MSRFVLPIMLFLAGCITPAICVVKSITFNQECGGFLKQAADANTSDIALKRINLALDYIERNHLTEGYTSVMWRTEDENIGFWYENIKACQSELEACKDGTQLEKSNVLMKVRESLTDEGESGTKLTIPAGIHKYPYNAFWSIMETLGSIGMVIALIWIMGIWDKMW